jgi:uncharacterized protein (DUF2235 family)
MKKRIVICADGTWNRPEVDPKKDVPTNVLKLARAVAPIADDAVPQQVFYDWGLGSYHDQIIAGATGEGLHKNIMDDYRYLVHNYAPGDEVFLFGFSRGAYTVRSLCGMLNNVGLVKRPYEPLIQAAFDHYKRPGKKHAPDGDESKKFRAAHSHPVFKIKFVGVFDTVGAMGIPISFLGLFQDKDEFYDTKIGPNIEIARHALAIDEQRSDFEPTVWQPRPMLDLMQVWFAGAHGDVGGGYPRDGDQSALSDNTLSWMISEAKSAGLTCEAHLAQSIKASALASVHQSRRSFYRIKAPFYREIDHGQGSVLIHSSVKKRWDQDPSYRPKNLKNYVDSKGFGTLVS